MRVHGAPMVFSWESLGSPVGLVLRPRCPTQRASTVPHAEAKTHESPRCSHGVSVGVPWETRGTTVVLRPRYPTQRLKPMRVHGAPMVFLWESLGSPVGLVLRPRCPHGIAMGLPLNKSVSTGLSSGLHGTSMGLYGAPVRLPRDLASDQTTTRAAPQRAARSLSPGYARRLARSTFLTIVRL